MTGTDPAEVARDVAETVLWPNALRTDRAERVPTENLDALADAGLYGLFAPPEIGGLGAGDDQITDAVEAVARGCLTTALVWVQHFRLMRALLYPGPLGRTWAADFATGRRRAAVVFGGLLPGPPTLTAEKHEGGWVLDGRVPWVSGWGMVDTLYVAARGPGDTVVSVAVDAVEATGLSVERVRLAALDASVTVEATFDRFVVPADRLLTIEPHDPEGALGRSLRVNGSLALGVASRCCDLIGPSRLDDELVERRQELDEADDDQMAAARAAASAFAVKASTALVVRSGSRAVRADHHAQRLHGEAMFLLVFGSRPAIRHALEGRFLS